MNQEAGKTSEKGKIIKRVMTPELEASLRIYRGYHPGSILTWTPSVFREHAPKSDWPLFKYKPRNSKQIAEDEDEIMVIRIQGYTTNNAGTRRFQITRRQTIEFKNYKDKDGKEIACEIGEDKMITEECWLKISHEILILYMEAMKEEESLTPEELEGLEF